jgi:hypothetical protein
MSLDEASKAAIVQYLREGFPIRECGNRMILVARVNHREQLVAVERFCQRLGRSQLSHHAQETRVSRMPATRHCNNGYLWKGLP